MIACMIEAPHLPVDTRIDKPIGDGTTEEQVIETEAGVPLPRKPQVVPEGVDALFRMARPPVPEQDPRV
jgi:hypothetical protein